MKFGIALKLFFSILIVTIITASAMGFATHYSFSHGFIKYIKERDDKSFESLRNTLIDAYQESRDWSFIRKDRRVWRFIRHGNSNDDYSAYGPIALYDQDKQPIVGPRNLILHAPLFPIEVNGQTIGYLARPPLPKIFTQVDQRFEASQYRAIVVISILSVLLVAAMAMILTRILLTPLKRIGTAAQSLASGNYSVNIDITGRDEIGQLGQDFNHLARTLARNEASRREFMADIAHELRTPLAILKGEIEALADGVRSLTPESIASLATEVATLNKLIDDLGQLSQADIGALTYHKSIIDLSEILERVLSGYQDRFARKHITVQNNVKIKPMISGDPERLAQLFGNLFENTLRYTDPEGRVQIDARKEGQKIVLDLQDSAPGVPEAALPRLFERLYRLESSRNRASGGSGLGLSIAARIVEAHNGTIAAYPSSLGGIRISVTFPIQSIHGLEQK